jgi:hypothetical protein
MRIIRDHKLAIAAAAAMLAGSAAWAAIPDSAGVITSCRDSQGYVRVIDTATTTTCPAGTTNLQWNQQGRTGPIGPVGPQGAPGNANAYWVHLDPQGRVIEKQPASASGGMWSAGRYFIYLQAAELSKCAIHATPAGGTPGITTTVLGAWGNAAYVDTNAITESSWPVKWAPVKSEIYISASC